MANNVSSVSRMCHQASIGSVLRGKKGHLLVDKGEKSTLHTFEMVQACDKVNELRTCFTGDVSPLSSIAIKAGGVHLTGTVHRTRATTMNRDVLETRHIRI